MQRNGLRRVLRLQPAAAQRLVTAIVADFRCIGPRNENIHDCRFAIDTWRALANSRAGVPIPGE
jgi:hypothetical protein